MGEMKINISDNLADQRARELAEDCKAQDPRAAQFIEKAMADERRRVLEEVEALKNIESHCDRIAVLSKCSGSIKEAQMAQVEAKRLLARLGEQ